MRERDNYVLPISTYEEYLKKLDYMTYGIITYFSNKTKANEDGSNDLFRWIYKNKLIEHQDEIEKLSKNKFNTVMKNVRKLAKFLAVLVLTRGALTMRF